MHLIKLGLAGVVAVMALTLFATATPSEKASADPLHVTALSEGNCIALGVAFAGLPATTALTACTSMWGQPNMQTYVGCLRGNDSNLDGAKECLPPDPSAPFLPEPADFAGLDIDANQIHLGIAYEIIAFVNDDFPVRFTADMGTFDDPAGGRLPGHYECNTALEDADCDNDPATVGDHVVVGRFQLLAGDPTSGKVHIVVNQEGIGFPVDLDIVGQPDSITMSPLFGKDTIQTGATQGTDSRCSLDPHDPSTNPCQAPDSSDCNFAATADGVLGAVNQAEKTVIVVKALDNEGNPVIGALLNWDHSFKREKNVLPATPDLGPLPQGGVALPSTPTIDTGPLGFSFPQFVCGGDTTGDMKLTVTFNGTYDTPTPAGLASHATITIHVIGPAVDMALTADPPELDCNGTNTTKITAKVANAEGDPVANGLDVNFNVQALGTLTPLKGDTASGESSTVLTPLAGAGALTADGGPSGVVVTASANGQIHELFGQPRNKPHQKWDQVTRSILVRCTGGPPPPGTGVAAPAGGSAGAGSAPTGRIAGPDTGAAGVPSGSALTWWPLLAMLSAAMTLAGVTTVVRNRR